MSFDLDLSTYKKATHLIDDVNQLDTIHLPFGDEELVFKWVVKMEGLEDKDGYDFTDLSIELVGAPNPAALGTAKAFLRSVKSDGKYEARLHQYQATIRQLNERLEKAEKAVESEAMPGADDEKTNLLRNRLRAVTAELAGWRARAFEYATGRGTMASEEMMAEFRLKVATCLEIASDVAGDQSSLYASGVQLFAMCSEAHPLVQWRLTELIANQAWSVDDETEASIQIKFEAINALLMRSRKWWFERLGVASWRLAKSGYEWMKTKSGALWAGVRWSGTASDSEAEGEAKGFKHRAGSWLNGGYQFVANAALARARNFANVGRIYFNFFSVVKKDIGRNPDASKAGKVGYGALSVVANVLLLPFFIIAAAAKSESVTEETVINFAGRPGTAGKAKEEDHEPIFVVHGDETPKA